MMLTPACAVMLGAAGPRARADPFGKIPEFKFCAAKVEAIAGAEAA